MTEIEITLTTSIYGGESMGRLLDPLTGASGRAIFVPFALPGETVRARIFEQKRGFVRATLLEVLKAAPQRIAPKCRHFGVCGGCHYQILSYPDQLKLKESVLRDQLTRIGKIENPPVQGMIASPMEWNYRNHIQFHLTGEGRPGFVAADNRSAACASTAGTGERSQPSPQAVVPISECHLPEAGSNALWPQLEFDAASPLQRVSLRAGDELMLILESDSPETPEMEIEAEISVVHLTEDDAIVLAGDDHIVIEVLGRPFQVSAASFFQVNTGMAAKMVEHLLAELPVSQSTTFLDVYCGVGLFSAFFAPKVARLIGIEVSPSACEDFAVNLDEFDNVELYEAPAEDVLPNIDLHPDVVLVDPPRTGLDKKVLDALLALQPQTIAYISCDPSTLARDAARLIAGGYHLMEVTPFDLFPQTYHIECISVFVK